MKKLFEDDKNELKSGLNDKFEAEVVAFLNSKLGGDIFNVSENFIQITFTYEGNPDTDQVSDQVTDQVTDQVNELLFKLGNETLSISELMEIMKLKHRHTFRTNYIHPAMDMKLIEQTMPESPNSPKQKYRLTKRGKELLNSLSDV